MNRNLRVVYQTNSSLKLYHFRMGHLKICDYFLHSEWEMRISPLVLLYLQFFFSCVVKN